MPKILYWQFLSATKYINLTNYSDLWDSLISCSIAETYETFLYSFPFTWRMLSNSRKFSSIPFLFVIVNQVCRVFHRKFRVPVFPSISFTGIELQFLLAWFPFPIPSPTAVCWQKSALPVGAQGGVIWLRYLSFSCSI